MGRESHFWGPKTPSSRLLRVDFGELYTGEVRAHPFSALREEATASTGLAVDSSF